MGMEFTCMCLCGYGVYVGMEFVWVWSLCEYGVWGLKYMYYELWGDLRNRKALHAYIMYILYSKVRGRL